MLPHDFESEQILFSACVQDPGIIPMVDARLTEEGMVSKLHKPKWDTIKSLYEQNLQINFETFIAEYVRNNPETPDIGDISESITKATSSANWEYWAKRIADRHLKRQVTKWGNALIASDEEHVSEEMVKIINSYEQTVKSINSKTQTMEEITRDTQARLEEGDRVKTNIPQLDAISGGLTKKEMTILAGRPSHGKSITAVDIGLKIDPSERVLIVNYEMKNNESLKRIIPRYSLITYTDLIKNPETISEELLRNAYDHIIEQHSNIRMVYRPENFAELRSEVLRFKPTVVVLDHFHKINDYPEMLHQPRLRMNRIINDWTDLSIRHDFALLGLAQLNRSIEERIEKIPTMADLKETGNFEEYAEAIVFLYREFVYKPKTADKYEIKFIIGKARYGETKQFTMGFNGAKQQFFDTPDLARES